ncbi:hypothetical protein AGMMS50229_05780 [Campylobacterota bacterium]|nr:hypothetical protein AGMMS50229_05780 [Campylobacterota bacterium]
MIDDQALRMIDANLNRLREGIRVVEEICRFVFNNASMAKELKNLRHLVRSSAALEALKTRDSQNDVLRPTITVENDRSDLQSVLIANFKRSQESARVLEELLKLFNTDEAEQFKQIRYTLYTLEKQLLTK